MLSFRQLKPPDLSSVLEVQEIVRRHLADPTLYYSDDKEHFARILDGAGAIFGAFYGDTLAGYGVVAFPGNAAENLGFDVPHLRIEPEAVAHLDGSGVRPERRGLGIQRTLSEMRVRYAADRGATDLLMTVAPANYFSLRTHLNVGRFQAHGLKRKYGGLWRLVLHRPVSLPATAAPEASGWSALEDLEGHRRMLASGGFGFRVAYHDGVWRMAYAGLAADGHGKAQQQLAADERR